jgi:hypothetical protein
MAVSEARKRTPSGARVRARLKIQEVLRFLTRFPGGEPSHGVGAAGSPDMPVAPLQSLLLVFAG